MWLKLRSAAPVTQWTPLALEGLDVFTHDNRKPQLKQREKTSRCRTVHWQKIAHLQIRAIYIQMTNYIHHQCIPCSTKIACDTQLHWYLINNTLHHLCCCILNKMCWASVAVSTRCWSHMRGKRTICYIYNNFLPQDCLHGLYSDRIFCANRCFLPHAVNCVRFCFWQCLWLFCLCVKYLQNRWTDLRQIHREVVPRSVEFEWQGQRSRSPGTKNVFFGRYIGNRWIDLDQIHTKTCLVRLRRVWRSRSLWTKNGVFGGYLGNRWTDLRQIQAEDVFGPSLGQVSRAL